MSKLQLIENWKECWRFASVQLVVLLGLLDLAYDYLPALQAYLPAQWVQILALAIVVARIVRQSKMKEP